MSELRRTVQLVPGAVGMVYLRYALSRQVLARITIPFRGWVYVELWMLPPINPSGSEYSLNGWMAPNFGASGLLLCWKVESKKAYLQSVRRLIITRMPGPNTLSA
ncbi:hypothetical protein MN608_01245 [Microdochium nivale]|nr:hypothetical protein MN608_01245 [Microdochium nivale]